MSEDPQSDQTSPSSPPPVIDYRAPEPKRRIAKYVWGTVGGFFAVVVVSVIGTFTSMSSNSAIPLYVAGAAIVAGGVVQFWAFRRSGWATGFLLGAVVIALLVAGCGYLIYPLNIP